MSTTTGVTAAFGAASGCVTSYFVEVTSFLVEAFNEWETLPSSVRAGALTILFTGGGLAGGTVWYLHDSGGEANLSQISLQQSQAITSRHENTPNDFVVEAGINADSSIKCNYLKP
jgi:hypothetical protein